MAEIQNAVDSSYLHLAAEYLILRKLAFLNRWIEAGREKVREKRSAFPRQAVFPSKLYWEIEKFRTNDPELASAFSSFPMFDRRLR